MSDFKKRVEKDPGYLSYLCVECGRRDFYSKQEFLDHFEQHDNCWTPENEYEAKAEAITWSE